MPSTLSRPLVVLIAIMEPGAVRELHDYVVTEGGQVHSAAGTVGASRQTQPAGPRVYMVTSPDLAEAVSIVRRLHGSRSFRTLLVGVRGDVGTRLAAWEAGADRVLPEGTSRREVMAHIRALSRRDPAGSPSSGDLSIGAWIFQPGQHQLLTPRGQRVSLTAKESRLLAVLAARRGEVVSRDDLRLGTGAREKGQTTRIVDRLVFGLRKKLAGHENGGALISTVHRRGYALGRDDLHHAELDRLCIDLATSAVESVTAETTQPHNRRRGLVNRVDRQPGQASPDNAF